MQPIQRMKLIWATVQNAIGAPGAQVFFPDAPELRGKRITGLETIVAGQMANVPAGTAVIAAAAEWTITLVDDASRETFIQVPFSAFNPINNLGIWKEFVSDNPGGYPVFDWQKCYIQNLVAVAVVPIAIPVLVHYLD